MTSKDAKQMEIVYADHLHYLRMAEPSVARERELMMLDEIESRLPSAERVKFRVMYGSDLMVRGARR